MEIFVKNEIFAYKDICEERDVCTYSTCIDEYTFLYIDPTPGA